MDKTGRKNKRYSAEFKVTVAEAYLSNEYGGYRRVAEKYNLRSKRVFDWVKIYRNQGPEAFLMENRGRSSNGGRKKQIKLDELSLEEQVEYLKMENDILKKVKALLRD